MERVVVLVAIWILAIVRQPQQAAAAVLVVLEWRPVSEPYDLAGTISRTCTMKRVHDETGMKDKNEPTETLNGSRNGFGKSNVFHCGERVHTLVKS